jgi:NitT/TauT family transport system ATP-binding protein
MNMENIAIKKVSASFFEKKEAKKLPLNAGRGRAGAKAPRDQKFFASRPARAFFQKRSACLPTTSLSTPSSPTGTEILNLRALEKTFGTAQALSPVTLTIGAGEFVSLIGPSGCGKSTLLKLIARLQTPTAGNIAWWGADFSHVGSTGKQLAFVFQDPTLMPWADVATNVRLPLDLANTPRAEADARVRAALEQVELAGRESAHPRELSGGMRMRVSIARAMVTEPDLLLMDEPFGALDEFTRNRLDEDLSALSAEQNLTTIFVTHSVYEAVFMSTRVIVMAANPGRVFAEYVIDEPLPRGAGFRDSDRFAARCRDLSKLLNDASIASRSPS